MIDGRPQKTNLVFALTAMLFFGCFSLPNAFSQANDISLAQSFPQGKLSEILIAQKDWRPFPKISDREAWEQIPASITVSLIKQAEACANDEIPVLPASVYLQFKRNGNRSNYQDIWGERRNRLHTLVIAECIENQGRFLDPIADLIWAICEETAWTWPAHIGPQKAGVDLPDVDDQVVALFSAQTSNTLVLTEYLLDEKLDSVSPLIRQRIRKEVDRRILTPFLTREFGWMGYSARAHQSYPNNWNPWICSNLLVSALLAETDEVRRVQLVHKTLDCLDNFLTYYPSDGSCDEGPSYWGRAGASLFDALEHVYDATNQQFDFYSHPLIQEIARFIYRVHIVDDYFVCLGDCDARSPISHELVYRFGKRIGDQRLQDLGAYGFDEKAWVESVKRNFDLNRYLHLLFHGNEPARSNPASPPFVRDGWLGHPDMQMMIARDEEGSANGLYVAAWGAHNGQSHNHNDVGNFVLFADGKPILIDIGRPTYTRQTFSSERYQIWAFQSGYHNLPTINGVDQENGTHYAANKVSYDANDSIAQIEMNIAAAYPRQAGIKSWKRTIRLNRGKNVEIIDAYSLQEASSNVIENLICAGKVEQTEPGMLLIHDREESVRIILAYDPQILAANVESIELDDSKLRSIWGEQLYRIRLQTINAKTQDTLWFRLAKQP
ncbi:MAG: heparinase [Candidatus Omnitrophota bacterium]|jgi:hypothetical protein|nr:MAG: heparinase [Candidatus Omnitrophota bacterium]